jgi:GNAT superfamily N-acetyltransferase
VTRFLFSVEDGLYSLLAQQGFRWGSTAMTPQIRIRPALAEEVPLLRTLIENSVRRLQADDYTPEQIEGALTTVFGVDTQLIADGTYLVAEVEPESGLLPGSPIVVGCGGWSKRNTLYGADQWTNRHNDLLDPRRDAAKIRAFFIHPDWARRGVGSRLLAACEGAARGAGFTRFEMGATLTGAKLFGTKGYRPVENVSIPLVNGASLTIVHMRKQA